jgi:phosphate transport system substrate-binding protein
MKRLWIFPLVLAAACASCGDSPQDQITIAGSTSFQPFVEMVAEAYEQGHPDVRILVQGGGSTAGVLAVRAGAATVGMVSRGLQPDEKDLSAMVAARDGIAVIVHPSSPLSNLTTDQIRGIFSGTVTDFGELGGPKGPVRPVTREEGSGTRGAFVDLLMGGRAITPAALVQDSNGSMRELIAHDPEAIGYISLGLVDGSVKALNIDGIRPARENVENGSYRLVRPFMFIFNGQLEGTARLFVDFVLSPQGQRMLEQEGLIAAK